MSNSQAKHTPGPWTYSTHEKGWSYTINISQADDAAYTPDWSDVAWATCQRERQSVQEANARLIAAAPEMHEALDSFPTDADYANAESYSNAVKAWWLSRALPALRKVDGAAA